MQRAQRRRWLPVLDLLLFLLLQKRHFCSSFSISETRRWSERTTVHSMLSHQPANQHGKRRSPSQSFTRTTTACRSSSLLIPHSIRTTTPVATAAVLAICTVIGYQFDRNKRLPNGSGIVATLVSAAVLWDNASTTVPNSFLVTLCWTHVLPASLALLLLSYYQKPISGVRKETVCDDDETVVTTIRRVLIPFGMASMGSLLGCWTSFQLACKFRWFASLRDAQVATACLSASYVGGSVNYFAVARRIQQQHACATLMSPPPAEDLLGSLATADMITMALYFAFLSISLDWKWLRSKFYMEDNKSNRNGVRKNTTQTTVTGSAKVRSSTESDNQQSSFQIIPGILLTAFSFGLVHMANGIEKLFGKWIPGTACAVIALVTPVLHAKIASRQWWQLYYFRTTARILADTFFLCFFASIGMGCDLTAAIRMGPACLLFSAVALTMHVVIALVGSSVLFAERTKVQLEDVWIASNAAIGGPATAAAFCSRLADTSKLKGRTLAATFYGCVGYAIGTMLGTGMYRLVGGSL